MNHGADGTLVTAVPDTGYHFASWSDGVPDRGAHRPERDGRATAYIASFAINTYTLTYAARRQRLDQRDQRRRP